MTQVEGREEQVPEIDLSPFAQMVGVRDKLEKMVQSGAPFEKGAILGILNEEQQEYARLPDFQNKARGLRILADAFEEGLFSTEQLLEAARINGKPEEKKGGLFGLFRRR